MGTHPIFESDFDCLTDCDRTAALTPKNRNMKATNLLVLISAAAAQAHYWSPEGSNIKALCGYCADGVACDVNTGACPAACSAGYSGKNCDEPVCTVDCGEEGKCASPNNCVCGYLYANDEEGGCYGLRKDGVKGAFSALVVITVAISFCGGLQTYLTKKQD